MSVIADWSYPTAIRFGAGRIVEIAEACSAAGIRRPLLVTDRGLASMLITDRTLGLLEASGLGRHIFSDVDSNPTDRNLDAGTAAFNAGNHDGVVAFGGGSALDLGKLIAFMAGQTLPVWEFEDGGDGWSRADTQGIQPIVAVPTTAGTGSEVGRAGVIVNTTNHTKKIIFHPQIMPKVVICDPDLTAGMPEAITVGTGMDAFAHCLEAYCSSSYHPMSQGIALEGMKLVWNNLPIVVKEPGNIEARGHMMSAAAMGAVAFQKGLGAIHALSHPIGAVYGTHHGMTNAVVMLSVLRMNRPAIETRMLEAASYLGVSGGFDGFLDAVDSLQSGLGVPRGLSQLGVGTDRLAELAAMALEDPNAERNPVPMTLANTSALLRDCI